MNIHDVAVRKFVLNIPLGTYFLLFSPAAAAAAARGPLERWIVCRATPAIFRRKFSIRTSEQCDARKVSNGVRPGERRLERIARANRRHPLR